MFVPWVYVYSAILHESIQFILDTENIPRTIYNIETTSSIDDIIHDRHILTVLCVKEYVRIEVTKLRRAEDFKR